MKLLLTAAVFAIVYVGSLVGGSWVVAERLKDVQVSIADRDALIDGILEASGRTATGVASLGFELRRTGSQLSSDAAKMAADVEYLGEIVDQRRPVSHGELHCVDVLVTPAEVLARGAYQEAFMEQCEGDLTMRGPYHFPREFMQQMLLNRIISLEGVLRAADVAVPEGDYMQWVERVFEEELG